MPKINLAEYLKKEMKLLEKVKQLLLEELEYLNSRNYSKYGKLVKRKEKMLEQLAELQRTRQELFPTQSLNTFMLEGEQEMVLASGYMALAREVQDLNETIVLLVQMEKAYAQTFVESVEKVATGERTYNQTGAYDSSTEVESTIINRRF